MIVHSFDRFGRIAEFDPFTGRLGPETLHAGSEDARYECVFGHYGSLAGRTVVLFRFEGMLTLRSEEMVVALDDTVSVIHRCHVGACTVQVLSKSSGNSLLRLDYALPDTITPLEDDPTPFVEVEDFDFGLFIANVANNPERKARIYR